VAGISEYLPMQRLMSLACVVVALLLAAAAPAVASAPVVDTPAAENAASTAPTAPIYIFRGGLDIFSTGMNVLADELNKRGIKAVSENYAQWRDAFDDIVKSYRARPYPIVLVGHSFGANTSLLMSYELMKLKIPVALIALYDATDSARVPSNVRWVLNFRSGASTGANVEITGGAHFRGRIDNVTMGNLNHMEIDKREDLHKQTIDAIVTVMGGRVKSADLAQ
jgi:hypothetical protein